MSRPEVYRALARRYGWTFDQIADMPPTAQQEALRHDKKKNNDPLRFDTEDEYLAWKMTQSR
jgi:hypothetical protein